MIITRGGEAMRYLLYETCSYIVDAETPKEALQKFLKHCAAFTDPKAAAADGVEFVASEERDLQDNDGNQWDDSVLIEEEGADNGKT
jgi:hypothetical protein